MPLLAILPPKPCLFQSKKHYEFHKIIKIPNATKIRQRELHNTILLIWLITDISFSYFFASDFLKSSALFHFNFLQIRWEMHVFVLLQYFFHSPFGNVICIFTLGFSIENLFWMIQMLFSMKILWSPKPIKNRLRHWNQETIQIHFVYESYC